MMQERGQDRRVRECGPPNGLADRRQIAERRKIEISEASIDEFEFLRSASSFRSSGSIDVLA